MAISFSFLQAATADTTDTTTYTFSGESLGTADADRTIVCAIHAFVAGSDKHLTLVPDTVTIGGVTAEVQTQYARGSASGTSMVGIWTASVPTGATGDVVVTMSETCNACQIALWRATGLHSKTARWTNAKNAGNSALIDSVANSVIVAAGSSYGDGTTSWTGLSTVDYDGTVESRTFSAASEEFVASQTDLSVYPTFSSESLGVNVICSFAPEEYSFPSRANEFRVMITSAGKSGWSDDARMQELNQINGTNIIGVSGTEPSVWDAVELPRVAGATTAGRLFFTNLELWQSLTNIGGGDLDDAATRADRHYDILSAYQTGRQGHITGDYSLLPEREYFSAIELDGGTNYEIWQDHNTAYLDRRCYETQDWIFLSIYPLFKEEDGWEIYARENIREARRIAPEKKIYPFIREYFISTTATDQLVPGPYFRRMLELCYDEGCEGVVIWTPTGTFDATETWWVQTDLFLDELTNKPPFITFPAPSQPVGPLAVQNLIPHANWKDRTSTFPADLPDLPPYWSDVSVSVNWEDKATFTDNGAYDTINIDSDVSPGRPSCRVGLFPVELNAEYTMYAYISEYTNTGGHDHGGMRDQRTGNSICNTTASYGGPGWYCVGVVPVAATNDMLIQIGLGFSTNTQGTLKIDRPGVVRGFIGPVTADGDQHGPLTSRELFAVPDPVALAPNRPLSQARETRAVNRAGWVTLDQLQKVHAKVQSDLARASRRNTGRKR